MHRRSFVSAATCAVASSALPWPVAVQGAGFHLPSQAFLSDLHWLMELAGVPGIAFGVVRGGRVPTTHAAGVTGADQTGAVTADTVFEAASLSKPVFAYLAMLLVQEGRLDLDRPLDSYLGAPYLQSDPRAAAITARHVLSHTTGYQNWRFNAQQVLATAFPPGERFQYSGEGYYQLQRAVETITGRGIAGVIRERVLEPLDMRGSSFLWRAEFAGKFAFGHRRDGTKAPSFSSSAGADLVRQVESQGRTAEGLMGDQVAAAFQAMSPPRPSLPVFLLPNVAGSLLTTVNDYLKFVAVAVGALAGPLDDAHRSRMYARQVGLRGALGWGLGWGLEQRGERNWIWHWGDNPGYKNFVIADLRLKQGVVVFTSGDNGRPVYERVVRACGAEDPGAFLRI